MNKELFKCAVIERLKARSNDFLYLMIRPQYYKDKSNSEYRESVDMYNAQLKLGMRFTKNESVEMGPRYGVLFVEDLEDNPFDSALIMNPELKRTICTETVIVKENAIVFTVVNRYITVDENFNITSEMSEPKRSIIFDATKGRFLTTDIEDILKYWTAVRRDNPYYDGLSMDLKTMNQFVDLIKKVDANPFLNADAGDKLRQLYHFCSYSEANLACPKMVMAIREFIEKYGH